MLRSTRFDAETCGVACRKAVSRGHDLAYIDNLPEDVARSRRFLHETIRFEIETQKARRAQRRDYREIDRRRRLARPLVAPKIIQPETPEAPHYAPESFFIVQKK
jgi:hypothetical protein